ncbi:MAG: hypothetical protein Q9161_003538 [Pseudevernia consocians]
MMSFISPCILYFQRRSYKVSAIDAIYIVIFTYLVLFSILNSLYVDSALDQKVAQLDTYDIKNLAINHIECSFPISSQYQKTPRYICYLLLVFTVAIRNHGWLAAGAAASVLSYSGVAAIHSLILFATNNRLHLQQAKTRCESIPTPGSDTQFVACAGVIDPDISTIVHIVSSVMLGALPIAAWSTTFRKSGNKAILLFWLLLLAIGHTFWPVTTLDQNFHFQICPKDNIEPLPQANYQAPLLDDSWSDSFHSLVLASQQASPFFDNGSVPACLYSCFATTAYIGRRSQDIIVTTFAKPNPFVKSAPEQRLAIILFWWAYAFLALLTLFTTEKQGRLPQWVRKRVCSVEYRQQSWMPIWKCKNKNRDATNIVNKSHGRGNDTITANSLATAKPHPMKHFQITILQLIQFIAQLCSVAASGGSILYNEITIGVVQGTLLEQEQFAAVGQWGCIAVVILVLFAAVVSRIWGADERSGRFGGVAAEKIRSLEKGDEWRDKEWMGSEEWDWRVGYAS